MGEELKPCSMLDDKREIMAIYWNDNDESHYVVGKFGITKIVAYGEPGEYCYKPWIAIYRGEFLIRRVPAGMVEIGYI